jgi:signal transduction histidine kinase
MQSSIHRYSVRAAAVAAVGLLFLAAAVGLLLMGSKRAADRDDGEAAARVAGDEVRRILERQVELHGRPAWTVGPRPVEPAEADFPRAEAVAVPGVEAVSVRSPQALAGPPTFSTDPAWTRLADFVPPPADADAMRVAIDRPSSASESPAYVASFQLPRGAHRLAAAAVNVRVRPALGVGRGVFEGQVYFGAAVLAVVIYLLGALSYLLRSSGERLLTRDREMSARLKAVRDVSGGIAHELRNPLNAIGLSVQVIERQMRASPDPTTAYARHFERVHLEIGRIKKVVDAFVKFARLGDLTVAETDFGALVREVVGGFGSVFAEAGVRATADVASGVTLRGDGEKLGEAVASVVQTAVEAMREHGGDLRIRLEANRREAVLTVRDSGPSLDDARLRNVFEPYRYGRDQEGFGLTVAKTIIESHGGRIEAASPPDGGCLVTIALPRRFA